MSIGKRLTELYNLLSEKNIVKNKQNFCEMFGIDKSNFSRYTRDELKLVIDFDNYDKFK